MVSKEAVICPFCKYEHSIMKALGTTGLVCYDGETGKTITCNKCGKDFICDYEVSYKFRTRKYY